MLQLASLLLLCGLLAAVASASDTVTGSASARVVMHVGTPDAEPPAVTITVGTSQWREFLHTVTFGLLFPQRQTVTVTAEDESGVAHVAYLTRKTALTAEEIRQDGLDWTDLTGDSFTVDPYAKLVVYVRAEDNCGNVGYYSSDGFIVQEAKVTENGILLVTDPGAMPAGTAAFMASYDTTGRMTGCCTGTVAAEGWLFDSRLASLGVRWKCFFLDADQRPVQEAIELTELPSA